MEQFRDVTITMDAVCKREHSIHKIAGNIIYELAKLKVISIPEVDEEARKFYDKVDEEEKQEEKELINEISVNKHIVCDSCAENLYVILQDIRQYCANNNRNMIIYGEAIDYIIAAIDKRVKEQTEGKS